MMKQITSSGRKIIVILIYFFCPNILLGQNQTIFPFFDSVIVYTLDTSKCSSNKAEIVMNNLINKCFKNRLKLNSKKTVELLDIINDTLTYGMPPLSCSIYDLGVVFYKGDTIVNYLSISFECDKVKSSFSMPANEKYKISAGSKDYYI